MGEIDVRCWDRMGRSGGKNSRSTSDADWGMSGRGSETSGLWQSGDGPNPLSDDCPPDMSSSRRWATLLPLLRFDGRLLVVERRGLPMRALPGAY